MNLQRKQKIKLTKKYIVHHYLEKNIFIINKWSFNQENKYLKDLFHMYMIQIMKNMQQK